MQKRRQPEAILADLEKKQDQLKARIQKKKAQIRSSERKKDTRRKIIVGALALEHMAYDDAFAAAIIKLLSRHVTERDKPLFAELLGDVPPENAADKETG